jgi:hypothetical protein
MLATGEKKWHSDDAGKKKRYEAKMFAQRKLLAQLN